jgi:polysaccharide deacetylase 2 family uncharacterized protein YibQ
MTRRRGARPGVGIGWLLTWPLGVVFAAMVFLTVEEIRRPSQGALPTPSAGEDWQAGFAGRIAAVTEAIEHSSLPLSKAVEEQRGSGALRWTHRLFEARMAIGDKEKAEATLAELRKVDPGIALTSSATFDGAEVRVGLDGLLTHPLRLHFHDAAQRPRIALVMGSLGDDLRLARECLGSDAPIALAVRPFRPFSREVAELGHMFQREILLDWDGGADGPPAPSGESVADPLRSRLDAAVATVPHLVGVVSSSGAVPVSAARIREALAGLGLFYLGAAEQDMVATVVVFDVEAGAGDDRLTALVAAARERGRAVGFSASTPGTPGALPAVLERLQKENVDLVPVSDLAVAAAATPS